MKYYIYVLMDDRYLGEYHNRYCTLNYRPFYVGKGFYGAKNKSERHLIHYKLNTKECEKSSNPQKCRVIKKLKDEGYQPNFKIVYENDDEKNVFGVEKELVKFYGKSLDGGYLTNICDGGTGGDTFTNHPNKEKIRKKHRNSVLGDKNPMYGLPIEKRPSHMAKINGDHWNKGKTMSDNHKKMLKTLRYERLPLIQKIETETFEVLDELKILDMVKKYGLSYGRLYYCLKNGGEHKGSYWKYKEKDLILKKTLRPDYQRSKINRKGCKIFFKENINDNVEIEFENIKDTSNKLGLSIETIRRKCRKNNTKIKVFRYENSEYFFDEKTGKKKSVKRIDGEGNVVIFDSATSAADSLNNGNVSIVIQVCKGKRKKHKGYKFEYLKND
jgi:hypothetical protein